MKEHIYNKRSKVTAAKVHYEKLHVQQEFYKKFTEEVLQMEKFQEGVLLKEPRYAMKFTRVRKGFGWLKALC